MVVKTVGRPRSSTKTYPSHIDAGKIPDRCYWDSSGNGHWYTTFTEGGKRRRKWIAGPDAKLSDLHKALEARERQESDSVNWLGEKFTSSPQFLQCSKAQQKSYQYSLGVIKAQPTIERDVFLGQVPLNDWDAPLIQVLIDTVATQRGPSAARKVYEYLRRLFNWAILRGLYRGTSPVSKPELPKERERRRLPDHAVLAKLITFAFERGQRAAHTEGSTSPYIWKALILGYECRLRGVESFDLTDASMLDEGIACKRRKGSKMNISLWNHNLRVCVKAAQEERNAIWKKLGRAIPLRPENRPLLVNGSGERISQSAWQNAWKRFMALAIREEVITADQKFGLHDMKRRGTTDTQGTKAEKLEASGLSSLQILEVYDHSIARVNSTSR